MWEVTCDLLLKGQRERGREYYGVIYSRVTTSLPLVGVLR